MDDKIDDIINYLTILKQQKLELREKENQIRKYTDLLLTRKSPSYDDCFMICSTDFDEDAVNIIGRHFAEFADMVYDQHFLLIVRKEINRNTGIYLLPFEDNCELNTTVEAIEKLIESKREEENYSRECQKRTYPEQKLKELKMLDTINVNMENMKIKTTFQVDEMQQKLDKLMNGLDFLTNEKILLSKAKLRESKIQRFYALKNFKCVRDSPEILEKMCMRLSVKKDEDDEELDPPFQDILTMEDKKEELLCYFDLLQQKLDDSTEKPEIQKNIAYWFKTNTSRFQYKPTITEVEKWIEEMEQKMKIQNTIGKVGRVSFKWNNIDTYYDLVLADNKIIIWSCGKNAAAIKYFHDILTLMKWDKNAKFAVDREISADFSDYFVYVPSDKLRKMSNNNRVVEWMNNNFESLKHGLNAEYGYSIPALYSLALEYFEETSE